MHCISESINFKNLKFMPDYHETNVHNNNIYILSFSTLILHRKIFRILMVEFFFLYQLSDSNWLNDKLCLARYYPDGSVVELWNITLSAQIEFLAWSFFTKLI